MKTLDEVIFEAPYIPTPWEADALYYLKEYRKRLSQDLDELRQKKYELEMKLDSMLQEKNWRNGR